jgi:hypothetical protein
MKITRPVIKLLNASLHKRINKPYYQFIPIGAIEEALEENGFAMVNEDATPFEAIFCGGDSRTTLPFAVKSSYDPEMFKSGGKSFPGYHAVVENSFVILSWHKMDSGKYEINVYVS